MTNPNLETYSSSKYTGLMTDYAGAYNVTASTIKGFKKVSMESMLNWNPDVIFVQNRYPEVVPETQQSEKWKSINTVK
ncbi:ABC transporter substrate-binding protein [Lonepinella sp. BR2882]|uniref:ABC transporter substrate-binding protein n=1 Tax=Lonepinella sp. BR2882 TaxID=3095283 RepID=UPI003F6E3159